MTSLRQRSRSIGHRVQDWRTFVAEYRFKMLGIEIGPITSAASIDAKPVIVDTLVRVNNNIIALT